MTQDNDAALPPVDVAGLVDKLRHWAEDDVRAMRRDVMLRADQFVDEIDLTRWADFMDEAATALERVARERDEAKRWNTECDNARNILIENVRILNEQVEAANWLAVETKRALEEKRLFAKTVERERDEARTRELSALQSASSIQDAALEYKARAEAAQARIAALEGALDQCRKEKNDLVIKAYPAMDRLDKALELLKMFRCRCRIYCIDAVHDCHRKKITTFLDAALASAPKGGE